jgi:hypothetical protein
MEAHLGTPFYFRRAADLEAGSAASGTGLEACATKFGFACAPLGIKDPG